MDRAEPKQQASRRELYEPPCVEDELEFETAALAQCGKVNSSGGDLCDRKLGGTESS
jgi:hypothetical protein